MSDFLNAVGTFLSECVAVSFLMLVVENMIFSRAFGTSTALVIIRKKNSLFLFGLVLTAITVLSGIVTYFAEPFLEPLPHVVYYRPFVYIAVIGAVYVAALLICGHLPSAIKTRLRPMIHISAFNSVVLGTLLLTVGEDLAFAASLGFGLGAGVGFTLATFFISVAYDYLYSAAIPRAFRGFPILLIYIGLLSLAFYGLVGHQLQY